MQDRANVSADFLEMMKQEIIEVIKKYIDVDEREIDVHLTNKTNEDGSAAAPALYANIPIVSIKHTGEIDGLQIKEKVQEEIEEKNNKDKKDTKNENSKEIKQEVKEEQGNKEEIESKQEEPKQENSEENKVR